MRYLYYFAFQEAPQRTRTHRLTLPKFDSFDTMPDSPEPVDLNLLGKARFVDWRQFI